MTKTETKTIRLYEHAETRARVVHPEGLEVEAHGWEYVAGDTIEIDGETHALTVVRGNIQTDDVRGNYVEAEAVVS